MKVHGCMSEGLTWLDFLLWLHANFGCQTMHMPVFDISRDCTFYSDRKSPSYLSPYSQLILFRSIATALQCFQSWVGITVQSFIITSLVCKSFDSTTSEWWKVIYVDSGTIQSVLNVMKAPSCKITSSIHGWSCKGLMWMLIMVRPRTVATHVKTQYRFKDKYGHGLTTKVCMQP